MHKPLNVPDMLSALALAYQRLTARLDPHGGADAQRLQAVLDDFRWYSERIGAARWHAVPRPNYWSFAEHLRHIAEQASAATSEPAPEPLVYFVDHGKEHIGQIAELIAIFQYDAQQA